MPSTTTNYGWPYGVLTDSPIDLLEIGTLVPEIDAQMAGTTTIGVPSGSVSIAGTAWTTVASVSITLPTAQPVEIVAWARLVNSGTSRAMVSLQVVDGSTHLFGIGQTHIGGTADTFGEEMTLFTPRRRVGLTSGAHTLNLQVYKDGNGTVDAKKTDTYASQLIATTGIEATY